MDPNPKNFPILSYVMTRLPSFVPKPSITASGSESEFVEIDIENPEAPSSKKSASDPSTSSSSSSSGHSRIVENMPHLSDPKVILSMTRAVSDVVQTRTVLKTIGERPDHETVDAARAKLSEIESNLAKRLEELVLSPRPADVERQQWRAHLAEKENEYRRSAEREKETCKVIIQLEEMHEAYEKLLSDAEARLEKIYESAEAGGTDAPEEEQRRVGGGESSEEVNEEVVGILQEANGTGLERVDLSGRRLRFLPEAFGRIRSLLVLNISDNVLEVGVGFF